MDKGKAPMKEEVLPFSAAGMDKGKAPMKEEMHSSKSVGHGQRKERLVPEMQLHPSLSTPQIREGFVDSNKKIADDVLLHRVEFVTPSNVQPSAEQWSADLSTQLVVYDPKSGQANPHAAKHNKAKRIRADCGTSRRNYHSRSVLVAQCALCLKWRIIPTAKLYEAIRATNIQDPFVCEKAQRWNRNVTCNDVTDMEPDGTIPWGLDQQNIPIAPHGWERLMPFRKYGGQRIADVYYRTPTGKKLRSFQEVERFLIENPQYMHPGISMDQFSFLIPEPLDLEIWNNKG